MKQKLRIYLAGALGIFLLASLGMAVWEKNKNKVEMVQKQQEKNQIQQEIKNLGEEKDDRGCLISSGYFWCEEKQSCLQNWDETCGNVDILDTSFWENYTSKDFNIKFNFSFKYPDSWFTQGSIDGGSGSGIPFFEKNNYSRECHKELNDKRISCKQNGRIALVEILLPNSHPREVNYDNEKKKTIIIDNYKGFVVEGKVNDTNGGRVANNAQEEIRIAFSDIKGMRFEIIMKIENASDKKIFDKIISTLKFN